MIYKTQEDLEKDLDAKLQEGHLPPANIIVAGITGTGKSTLVNAIFDSEMAKADSGKPVTKDIYEYQNNDIPVHIWDTVGLELYSERAQASIKDIKDTIAEKAEQAKDLYDRIHAIWYCINSGSNRYQSAELEFIKSLHSVGVPFIIVMTQCSGDIEQTDAFEREIRRINRSEGLEDVEVVQVLAAPVKCEGEEIPSIGLEDLVNITLARLPDFIKTSFIAAQKVSKKQKRVECEKIIYSYVDNATRSFQGKFPILNIIYANKMIFAMVKDLAKLYNTHIPYEKTRVIVETCHLDFENIFKGLLLPRFMDQGYSMNITMLLRYKKQEGFSVESSVVDKRDRVARMVALYGYIFVEAIEEVWEGFTEDQLKDVDKVVNRLIDIINAKLKARTKRING